MAALDAEREIDGAIQTETRLSITACLGPAHLMRPIVRSHWGVENNLHRVMDRVFRDDACRVRTEHAPANATTLTHIALNLTRPHPKGKRQALPLRRKLAPWDDDFLPTLIAA